MRKKSIRTLEALSQHHLINPQQLPELEQVIDAFSLSITHQMQQLIDPSHANDPIGLQFVPHINELKLSPLEKKDPIGDDIHTAVKGVIHRYPDRCLFTPVHVCPVYCRFCFRKEKVGHADATLSPSELEMGFDYIANHPEIWEVIITGGDPLILKPAVLKLIMERLSAIPHIDVIRIHTRVPVVDSARIDAEMIAALKCSKAVYVLLHANHPKEFTSEAIAACALLIDAGIPMLSQTILLKNINDNIEVMSLLMRCFIKHRIKPYYLHHGDLARGTQHFRTSIEEGQALMRELRGRFSGLCQPSYVLDIPGGHGKVPIGPNYLHRMGPAYIIEDYCGQYHNYSSDLP